MKTSIAKQIQSVRQGYKAAVNPAPWSEPETKGDFFVTGALLPEAADASGDCDPLSQLQIQALADKAAKANNIGTDLVRAVIRQESAFRPCVVSPKGATGLMQLMPDTATELGVGDAFDPEQNVMGGAKLLRRLLDRYAGDLNRTLGAYNAGPTRVDKAEGIPPFPETMTYVDNIMRALSKDAARR